MRERLDVVANRLVEYRDRYDRARDSRAVFTHTYVSITLLIAEHLDSYKFNDPEWVVQLAERFAGRYFVALRVGRGLAWYNASRILDPFSRELAHESIVKSTIVFVDNVRRPKLWPVRWMFRIGRWIASWFRRWPVTPAELPRVPFSEPM